MYSSKTVLRIKSGQRHTDWTWSVLLSSSPPLLLSSSPLLLLLLLPSQVEKKRKNSSDCGKNPVASDWLGAMNLCVQLQGD
ncbi:hypothetical protein EYF80_056101 [Liparis tanakae]|uniref:Uncharacterized protein n=1 Tax=Liparis tanakae TaxID=230148 RepID=A0A4Z2EZC9_9TELE|nr:hypothetical protein EYF80_056101 [Liparis tanakae]